MSLDLSKLEKVENQGGKFTARCPVCAAGARDRKGDNLVVYGDKGEGAWGCQAGCDPKEIWELAGIRRPHRRRKIRDVLTGAWRYRQQDWAEEDWDIFRHDYYAAKACRYRTALDAIISKYAWTQAQAKAESAPLPTTPGEHFRCFVHSFREDDWLFFHERKGTGPGCCRRAGDWAKRTEPPYRYDATLPHERRYADHAHGWTWLPGSPTRNQSNRLRLRYRVVEIDKDPRTGGVMPIADQAAILRFCRDALGLDLRMVIYAGGKSLHGLVSAESCARRLRAIRLVLCGWNFVGGLGVDLMPYEHATTRTPGCIRNPDEGNDRMRHQSILYLDPHWPAWS